MRWQWCGGAWCRLVNWVGARRWWRVIDATAALIRYTFTKAVRHATEWMYACRGKVGAFHALARRRIAIITIVALPIFFSAHTTRLVAMKSHVSLRHTLCVEFSFHNLVFHVAMRCYCFCFERTHLHMLAQQTMAWRERIIIRSQRTIRQEWLATRFQFR